MRLEYHKRPREANKADFCALVQSGPPPGLLAFEGDLAVGWCQLTPRDALPWLDRVWRLQRVEWLENEVLTHMLAKETDNPLAKLTESLLADGINLMGDDPETDPRLALGRAVVKDFSGDGILDRLSISEQKMETSLFGIMDELRRLQRLRKQ